MRVTVTIEVDVDIDAWTQEYGTTGEGESVMQMLSDLEEPGEYLASPQWLDLATVSVANVELDHQPA